jgi:hypothetical protein
MTTPHNAPSSATDGDGVLTSSALRVFVLLAVLAAGLAVIVGPREAAPVVRPAHKVVHETRPRAYDLPPPPAPSSPTSTTSTPPVSSTSTTSTTAAPEAPTAADLNDSVPPPSTPAGVEWAVSSTVYCLDGHTASGEPVADGIVAVSYADWPRLRGTRWRVTAGPPEILGRTYRVADKGPAAHFDVWMGNRPNCPTWGRYTYGRRPATVVPA